MNVKTHGLVSHQSIETELKMVFWTSHLTMREDILSKYRIRKINVT